MIKHTKLFKYLAALTALFCFITVLSACNSGVAAATPPASPSAQASPSPDSDEWTVDESALTDEYLLSLVINPEIELTADNSFTFSDPDDLSSQELYMLFLGQTDSSELEQYLDDSDQMFHFTSDVITAQLSKYFKHFQFDITAVYNYEESSDTIVTANASGFGGDRYMKVTDKSLDGSTVTFTADFYDNYEMQGQPFQTKTYTIEFYDGGYYYLSAVEA